MISKKVTKTISNLSLTNKKNEHENTPLKYYYFWIQNWIEYAKREKKSILVLNYEDFVRSKEQYINQILNYLKINKNDFDFKRFESSKIKKSNMLSRNLQNYGRNKSTFRSGEVGQWQKLFDEEITNFFYQNLPDNLDKLKY